MGFLQALSRHPWYPNSVSRDPNWGWGRPQGGGGSQPCGKAEEVLPGSVWLSGNTIWTPPRKGVRRQEAAPPPLPPLHHWDFFGKQMVGGSGLKVGVLRQLGGLWPPGPCPHAGCDLHRPLPTSALPDPSQAQSPRSLEGT